MDARRSSSRAASPPVGAWELAGVAALVALGFGLRVAHVLAMEANPNHAEPIIDSAYHVEWALALASGENHASLADRPFFRAPLYPFFLAGLLWLFDGSLLAARLVQCGLGAATVGLVHLVGRRAFGPAAGALAAALAAVYWVLIYFDGELLIPTLAVPLDLAALWLTLGLATGARAGRAAGAGALWGLSAIARPNVLLFAPCLAAWLLWTRRRETARWAPALAAAAAFSLALLAPILPVTAWNTLAKGDFVLISSQGGVNFWIGNNPDSNGVDAVVPGTRADWWGGYHDSIRLAERAEGRSLRASEVSRYYAGRAWDFIREQPGDAAALWLKKLRLFWGAGELGNNESIAFSVREFSWMPAVTPAFALLAGFGLLGLVACRERPLALFPLWGFLLVYTFSVVAFFVCSRFRVPVLPVLMVLAAGAGLDLWRWARARRLGPLAAGLAFVAVFASWSAAQAPDPDRVEANGLYQLGVAAAQRGDTDRAVELLERAVALKPRHADVLRTLGQVRMARGEVEKGVAMLERAIAAAPLRPEAFEILMQHLIAAGRFDEAEDQIGNYLDRLRQLGAWRVSGHPYYHLGRVRAAHGDRAGARRAFEQALRLNPASQRAREALEELGEGEGGEDA